MKYLQRKGSYGSLRKQTSKTSNFTEFNLTHDDYTCVFSIPMEFEIHFLGSHKKLSWFYYR